MPSIHYTIQAIDPSAHLFEVSCTVKNPTPDGQLFYVPAWVPGSYKIRDFAKHISHVHAESQGKVIDCFKLDKQTWQCAPTSQAVTIRYLVYAWDLSVRGSHLDQTHSTINPATLCMCVVGKENEPCVVEIKRPAGAAYKKWRVATAMKCKNANAFEFGEYEASNYAELIDHPIELGDFVVTTFTEKGIPHEIVFSGLAPNTDIKRITKDLQRVCAYYLSFFPKPYPMDRYVFLVILLDQGFGGLEHRASCCLHFSKYGLPTPADETVNDVYMSFLTLCSHEYLHTWLVKGIKPANFSPYDLYRENYTGQLWVFEGFTAYYEDLALMRSGLITEQQFFSILAQKIIRLWRTPGRTTQSVIESSYDAWIKFYQPDENTPNITVSYYLKGSLIALILDISLRSLTQNKESLDTIVLELWKQYADAPEGVTESALIEIIQQRVGNILDPLLNELLYSTIELPLEEILEKVGVHLSHRPTKMLADKGDVFFKSLENKTHQNLCAQTPESRTPVDLGVIWDLKQSAAVILFCLIGSAAQKAGLSAGDIVVAVDQLRVDTATLALHLARYVPGDKITVHAFRRDLLLEFTLTLEAAMPVPVLTIDDSSSSPDVVRRKAWLS